LKKEIKEAGKELGFDNFVNSVEDLQAVWKDAQNLSGRGRLAFTALKSRGALYVVAALSIFVVPSVIAILLNKVNLGKSFYTMGLLAIILISFIALCIMMLKN